MTKEERNKEIVSQWFKGFWANRWDPGIVEQLASPTFSSSILFTLRGAASRT